jgi:endonuclease/exonuclease/phosphatase (EEP) superfamily protein YafD
MNNGESPVQNTGNVAPAENAVAPQPAVNTVAPAAPSNESATEKLLTQSVVNGIVGSVKQEAFDKGYTKGKNETQAEYEARVNSNPVNQQPANTGIVNQQPANNLSEDKILAMIEEQAQQKANESMAQQTVNEFVQKMTAAKDKHPDFEETVTKLNLPSMPGIVQLANLTDNTADVMYELGKHPVKLANLKAVIRETPELAMEEFKKLSNSIKQNETAQNQQSQTAEPLEQIKPSNTGTDNGSMSVGDFQKQPWLKG